MDPRLFASLEWRCIGPHRGGRVVTVAGHPTELGTFYFGACAGGVFKTTNGGSHWENVSDGYFNTAAVGAIAVSDSDPNVIYAGTGEACIRSNVSHGDGVYRSDDGGATWRNVGLAPTRHISDVVIHPHDPDTVYVAALGHAWGPNPERGIYRSTNGGRSWDLVLHKTPQAGAADLTMDPRNPRVLYAAMWQGRRFPHAAASGGEDSGIWRSLDGGDTWTDLTRKSGLPKGMLGRIGLAASPAKPGRVWAIVEAEDGAMFRSDDYGETWERLCEDPDLRRRPWYYMHTFADPQDPNTVWVMNLQCWRSLDAGKTFEAIPTPHGDNHALWIDPRNSLRMIQGNDGGACVTFDGARSWSSLLNQPTAQFYHVTTDAHVPYRVYGSQQDNWAMRVPSISFEGAISWKDYVEPGGGESGYIAISPRPPHLVFGGGIGTGPGHGRLIAWNPETGQKRNVTVWPEVFGMGAGAESMKYRFQWTFPVEFSPHADNTLYVCSNVVHRSTDEGASWEVISPDLTRNDPDKLHPSGGPITADNSGAEIYCTIFAFRESPHEAGVFWAGSDDGLVHISRDAGQNWQPITPPGLPEWAMISIIEPSPHDAGTAYVAATCYKSDDLRPFLFKTTDYGASWTQITNGIPADEFTRVIRADPNRRGVLYCGTERGIHVSLDDGASWSFLQTNLPVTPIWDLVVKGTDLVAATHGRAFWILDDVTPLYQLQAATGNVSSGERAGSRSGNVSSSQSEAAGRQPGNVSSGSTGSTRAQDGGGPAANVSSSQSGNVSTAHAADTVLGDAYLFAPRDTVRFKLYGRAYDPKTKAFTNYKMTGPVTVAYKLVETPSGRRVEKFYDAGQNPPEGVIIHYWLGSEPDSVKLTILDSNANEVRSYSSKRETAATPEPPSEGAVQEATAEEEVSSESSEPVEEKGPWAPTQVGMNRFIWDYRYAKPVKLERKPPKRGGGDEAEAAAPPRAVPGEYEVRLTVGQHTLSQRFRILPDPRLPVSEADLRAQFEFRLGIRDRLSETHACINAILKVRAQVEEWERRSPELKSLAEPLKQRLNELEAELVNVEADKPRPGPNRIKEKLDTLGAMADESDHAPTRGAQEVYEQLRGQLEDVRRRFDQLVQTDVKQFSERVQSLNIPAIVV